jgi:hypothetical protein
MRHIRFLLAKRRASVIAPVFVAALISAAAGAVYARRAQVSAGAASVIELDQRRRRYLHELDEHCGPRLA